MATAAAATADMPATTTAGSSTAARAGGRRCPLAALRLLAHAVAVAGVAQRAVAVVGA